MAPSSSTTSSLPPHSRQCPQFTPIQEGLEEVDEQQQQQQQKHFKSSTPNNGSCSTEKRIITVHHTTPLHHQTGTRKRPESDVTTSGGDDTRGVLCNKCRPNAREKISVVPLDNSSGISPNNIFKSLISTLTRKSPRSSSETSSASTTPREEPWKVVLGELSQKLIHATRKRDEAVLEASRLKYSMAELEKKLNKLETYCHSLKSGLEICNNNNIINSPHKINKSQQIQQQNYHFSHIEIPNAGKVIENFLVSVSESRSSIRVLSRALAMQLRQVNGKVIERISNLLQPHDIKITMSRNPRSLLSYLEALLNRAFYEDFESIGFVKNSSNQILNSINRCESNYASFSVLQRLTWEDVLNKGTKHFSDEFSKFCDRKMSEIVTIVGWNRVWPEPLLLAFFGASKNVWLVHLLATSVHPSLPIFRIDNGVAFDSVYMEDAGGDRAKRLVPTLVRLMVAPGFYVYGNVVKCKVLCRYYNISNTINNPNNQNIASLSP